MKLKLSFLICLFLSYTYAQQFPLSPAAEVSVLTVGPGKSLNDAFGHNAFRIKDQSRGLDVVFGYGEYDFDAPNFYLKFAQGKLNYLISKNNFSDFYKFYSFYDRTVDEQILDLNLSEKQRLYDFLTDNYKPENRKYLYDFFYDNCATKIRDVTEDITHDKLTFDQPKEFESKTFRDLIHEHVGLNTWGSFGIDLALGSVIDRDASPYEHMFLPKYIHLFFGNAKTKNGKNLVSSSSTIYQKKGMDLKTNFFLSPLFITLLLSAIIIYITYRDAKLNKRSNWLDLALMSITTLIGIVLFLLWFATDHSATAYNYNLLWAFPLNMILIPQLLKKQPKNWVKGYIKFLLLMLILMTLHWFIGVQAFSVVLIPIILALAIRYAYVLNRLTKD